MMTVNAEVKPCDREEYQKLYDDMQGKRGDLTEYIRAKYLVMTHACSGIRHLPSYMEKETN